MSYISKAIGRVFVLDVDDVRARMLVRLADRGRQRAIARVAGVGHHERAGHLTPLQTLQARPVRPPRAPPGGPAMVAITRAVAVPQEIHRCHGWVLRVWLRSGWKPAPARTGGAGPRPSSRRGVHGRPGFVLRPTAAPGLASPGS